MQLFSVFILFLKALFEPPESDLTLILIRFSDPEILSKKPFKDSLRKIFVTSKDLGVIWPILEELWVGHRITALPIGGDFFYDFFQSYVHIGMVTVQHSTEHKSKKAFKSKKKSIIFWLIAVVVKKYGFLLASGD